VRRVRVKSSDPFCILALFPSPSVRPTWDISPIYILSMFVPLVHLSPFSPPDRRTITFAVLACTVYSMRASCRRQCRFLFLKGASWSRHNGIIAKRCGTAADSAPVTCESISTVALRLLGNAAEGVEAAAVLATRGFPIGTVEEITCLTTSTSKAFAASLVVTPTWDAECRTAGNSGVVVAHKPFKVTGTIRIARAGEITETDALGRGISENSHPVRSVKSASVPIVAHLTLAAWLVFCTALLTCRFTRTGFIDAGKTLR